MQLEDIKPQKQAKTVYPSTVPHWWRLECCSRIPLYTNDRGDADQQMVMDRLTNALYMKRITPTEYESLVHIIRDHAFGERGTSSIPNVGEPYLYLLWRAGIVGRGECPLYLFVLRTLLGLAIAALIFWLQKESVFMDVDLWITILVASALPGFIFRMLDNKHMYGEYLPDQAIAYLNRWLVFAAIVSPIWGCVAWLQPVYRMPLNAAHWIAIFIANALVWGAILVCILTLKLFGRYPYSESRYFLNFP
jgi:hypothetical protein